MKKIWLIVIIVISIALWSVNLLYALKAKENSSNLWGDAFGMANSLFSFAAFAGVLFSLFLQRKEHDGQKKDNFETTFFKMLDQLHNISNGTILTEKPAMADVLGGFQNTVYSGNEYFSNAFKELLTELRTDRRGEIALANTSDNRYELLKTLLKIFPMEKGDSIFSNKIVLLSRYFLPDPLLEDPERRISKEEIRKYIEIVYDDFLKKHTDNIDHFYRYLNSLLKFIKKGENELSINSIFYYKLVQAQLTNAQLGLLFYSSITKVAENSAGINEFAQMLDESSLLENLPKSHCPQKMLLSFYPLTNFKHINQK